MENNKPVEHEAVRRRRLLQGMVAGVLALTAVAVAVVYRWKSARETESSRSPSSLPTNINQQLSGYTFTRSDAGRQIFTIHAARTVAFKQGGTTVLEDVWVELFGRAGDRRDLLRTHRCEYNAQSGDLSSPGKVQIELNARRGEPTAAATPGPEPVYLDTSQVFFRQQGSLLVSHEPVKYRFGNVSGSARGMTYATDEGSLELHKDVRVEVSPQEDPGVGAPIRLRASRARYTRDKGEVSLQGPVEVSQGARRARAVRGTIWLDDANRVTRARLEGGGRAEEVSEKGRLDGRAEVFDGKFDAPRRRLQTLAARGGVVLESRRGASLSRLASRELTVAFSSADGHASAGTARGDVHLYRESPVESERKAGRAQNPVNPPVEKKELRAPEVRFAFRDGGETLKDAETVGEGKLVLTPPADRQVGEHVVTAGKFLMDFDARSRLERLRGVSGTRIVFKAPPNAPPQSVAQESSADRLEANFDAPTQTLRALEQAGALQVQDGERQASAERGQFIAQTQTLMLMGRPQVWDSTSRTRAERILFDLRANTALGVGKVQSTHFESGKGSGSGPSVPTNVLADRMLASRQSQTVRYEGNVRVWHGQDIIESSSLEFHRRERRVRSGSRVTTSHLQPAGLVTGGAKGLGGKLTARPVTIRADRLEYFDEGRRASYRGHVEMKTENTTLRARSMDVYFAGEPKVEGSEVERAVADGNVVVEQPERRATGEHAEYFAGRGEILLTGGPPTLHDVEKGFTTGRRLTFNTRDDRFQVDGGVGSSALSKHRIAP